MTGERKRVEPELQIVGQGANERVIPGRVAPGYPGQCNGEIALHGAGGRLAEDMEAIADLGLLQVAEEVVDLDESRRLVLGQADIGIEPAVAGEVENAALEIGEAAPVHAGGGIVFVEQRFEVFQGPIGLGAGERGHEVIDDDGAGAALGLGALARIVDDEGIEVGQLPPERIGVAIGIERGGLAGEPFERAMLAIVDERMGAELVAKPEIGGEIGVGRHQRRIVIARRLVELIAAGGLEQQDDIAEAMGRKVEGTVADEGIGRRIAPARGDGGADLLGERREEVGIAGERKNGGGRAAPGMRVGGTGEEAGDEVGGGGGESLGVQRRSLLPDGRGGNSGGGLA